MFYGLVLWGVGAILGNWKTEGLILLFLLSGVFFLFLGFAPCKAGQPLQCLELQEKEAQKGENIHKISLERMYS